ncbi:hypothetical protein C0J52_26082, partial [Blattella germanica]
LALIDLYDTTGRGWASGSGLTHGDGGEPDALDLLVRWGGATCSGPTQIRDVQDMSRVVTGKIDHGALGCGRDHEHYLDIRSLKQSSKASKLFIEICLKPPAQFRDCTRGSIIAAALVVNLIMSTKDMRLRSFTCSEKLKIIKDAEEHGNPASARKFDKKEALGTEDSTAQSCKLVLSTALGDTDLSHTELVPCDKCTLCKHQATMFLLQLVVIRNETLKHKGLMVNTEKCKVMQMGKTDEDIEIIQIECTGKFLEQVQSYEYLGTIIQQNGKVRKEIFNRIRKASSIYYQLSGTIFGKKEISQKTKLQVYKSVIEPIEHYLPCFIHSYNGQHVPGFRLPGRNILACSPMPQPGFGHGLGRHSHPCGWEQQSPGARRFGMLFLVIPVVGVRLPLPVVSFESREMRADAWRLLQT